jgi:methyltransferase-like protein/cyclopropane fatty-acyl-phospholipid synthase-like methyltransferase
MNTYDELPYLDHVIPETAPDRLAAMAILHGLSPPDPRSCRVLELGCANGANLLPMALAMPEATFLGIDLSTRQVEDGRARLATLGIANVELRALDLLDLDDGIGRFGYILCHGVYSWVAAAAREQILAICARHLEPDGVAYLSYNTYPGWHPRGMFREMLKYHTDSLATPVARVKEARAFLEFLARSTPDPDGSYARLLKDEQAILDSSSDSYVFHEHLEDENHPVYFTELVADAFRHGLHYLAPARFDPIDEHLPEAVQAALDGFGTDRIRREQYLDFVRNRTFRKSLLCHAGRPRSDVPLIEALDRLRFSSQARPVSERPDVRSDAPETFLTPTDDPFLATMPLVKAVLTALYATWPRSLTLDTLQAEVQDLLAPDDLVDGQLLRAVLLQAHRGSLVALHAFEPALAAEAGTRPRASLLARYQAEAAGTICNLRHRVVRLDDFDTLVLRLLDGTRDRDAIIAALAAWAASGVFTLNREGHAVEDEGQLLAALAESLEASLRKLAKYALLDG